MTKPEVLENEFARRDSTITTFWCHETPQIWLKHFQGGDRELHRFLEMKSNQKKQLKRAFLAFFGDISGKNLNKAVIAQTSFPCYETKGFAKKIVL